MKKNKQIKSDKPSKSNKFEKPIKSNKNTFKKKITNNNISSNNEKKNIDTTLVNNKFELELDNITDDEDNYIITKNLNNQIDFNLINRLPILNNLTNKIEFVSKLIDEESDSDNENKLENCNRDIDIDIENLTKDFISGKTIYYDYNKNIIYNYKFKIIGEINEDGEINLDDKQNDYEELEKSINSVDLNIENSESESESESETELYLN